MNNSSPTNNAACGATMLNVRFRSKIWPQLTLDETRSSHLFRIAQEALTNVARHARANRVTLDLHTDVGQLTLRIVDDGVGGISDYGGGITGMRERALLVNGRFTVCTSPGGGTEVRLTVPLTPEHQR